MFSPKYYKIEKLPFFKRIALGLMAMFNSFWNGLGHTIGSPIVGLNTFFVNERIVLDIEKLAKDDEANISANGTGHYFGDDGEDWKRAHREEYGSE